MTDPVRPLQDHALDNLRYIREAMERAGSFTSIPGVGGVIIGVTAVAAAIVAHPSARPGEPRWLKIWLAEAVVAALVAAVAMELKRRKARATWTSVAARRFFISYFAPIIAAAALTVVIGRTGSLAPLPPTWLLLYGASFVTSGAFSIRLVPLMGICFMLLGFIACFTPLPVGNVLLGAGFGGIHIVFGWMIARYHGG
ncbi:MAG TPA: hypothetical protein VFL80_02570 [Thermoanaerobaculia bacterium]|nr:hypothetical protein [Thermoanaerobaculia bacterium]